VVYYEAGERSGNAALNKNHVYTPERAVKSHSLYDRWGSLLLTLASVPVISPELASRHLVQWDSRIVAVTDGGGR
jgi:hypothetical protein